MGCLPAPSLRFANGIVLHDWHAEILAIRAFNLWVEPYFLRRIYPSAILTRAGQFSAS